VKPDVDHGESEVPSGGQGRCGQTGEGPRGLGGASDADPALGEGVRLGREAKKKIDRLFSVSALAPIAPSFASATTVTFNGTGAASTDPVVGITSPAGQPGSTGGPNDFSIAIGGEDPNNNGGAQITFNAAGADHNFVATSFLSRTTPGRENSPLTRPPIPASRSLFPLLRTLELVAGMRRSAEMP
jgi:hypothetical protein